MDLFETESIHLRTIHVHASHRQDDTQQQERVQPQDLHVVDVTEKFDTYLVASTLFYLPIEQQIDQSRIKRVNIDCDNLSEDHQKI